MTDQKQNEPKDAWRAWKRLLCSIAVHDWEFIGRFVFCRHPGCHKVAYRSLERRPDLDICDTRWVYDWTDVDF